MRRISILLTLAVAGFVPLCPSGRAAWGIGCAPAVAGPLPIPATAFHRWERLDENEWCLWVGNRQVGNLKNGEYRARLAPGRWAEEASEPPVPPPGEATAGIAAHKKCGCSKGCDCKASKCACSVEKRCAKDCKCHKALAPGATVEEDGTVNYGLNREKIDDAPATREIDGVKVTKEQLLTAIGKPAIPNDAEQLCLTAIGPDALRQRFVADVASAPSLSAWKGKIKIKDFAPDHWAVKATGFVAPSVYLQAPDGQVLYRWGDYPGAQAMAEVLRVKDPNYDPARDPPRKPGPTPPGGDGGGESVLGIVVLGVGGLGCFGVFALGCALGLVLLIRAFRQQRTA